MTDQMLASWMHIESASPTTTIHDSSFRQFVRCRCGYRSSHIFRRSRLGINGALLILLWMIEGIFIESIVTARVATPRLIARSTASIRTISFYSSLVLSERSRERGNISVLWLHQACKFVRQHMAVQVDSWGTYLTKGFSNIQGSTNRNIRRQYQLLRTFDLKLIGGADQGKRWLRIRLRLREQLERAVRLIPGMSVNEVSSHPCMDWWMQCSTL